MDFEVGGKVGRVKEELDGRSTEEEGDQNCGIWVACARHASA